MKTIKLFSIFQLDADRVLAIRDQVIKFLASPEKSDYDEIHIPSCFSKDYAISSVIKLTNSEHRVRHYDFIFDGREVDKASNRILDAIKGYAKPPKLEISEVSVTEDGVLRLNVKTIDDTAFSPDMMLNVIRAVGKTLRDNEEEIINGK